jgi:hypothetical protein
LAARRAFRYTTAVLPKKWNGDLLMQGGGETRSYLLLPLGKPQWVALRAVNRACWDDYARRILRSSPSGSSTILHSLSKTIV